MNRLVCVVLCLTLTAWASAAEDVDSLVAALRSGKPPAQIRAADKLGSMGNEAESAWQPLVDAVIEGSRPLKIHAIRALAKIHEIKSLPALQAIGNDKSDGQVRSEIQKLMKDFGPVDADHMDWIKHAREYVALPDRIKHISPAPFVAQKHEFRSFAEGNSGITSGSRILQVLNGAEALIDTGFPLTTVMIGGIDTSKMKALTYLTHQG